MSTNKPDDVGLEIVENMLGEYGLAISDEVFGRLSYSTRRLQSAGDKQLFIWRDSVVSFILDWDTWCPWKWVVKRRMKHIAEELAQEDRKRLRNTLKK